MKPISVVKIAALMRATAVGFEPDSMVTGFATDSGSVVPGDLFLAIEGARVDGHSFVSDALARGAVGAVVEKAVDGPHLLVGNLVRALASMAGAFRDRFDGPVFGVTGSAGKTTTKEFLAAALSPLGAILKTTGNRNTEYTAPLLWAELEPDHQAVVVEMAMRGFGQIAHLASFSRPTVGIITNIGYSHLEQVGTRRGIAKAKGELLEALPEDTGVGILWQGDPFLDSLRPKVRSGKVMTFGFTEYADCRITEYEAVDWSHSHLKGIVNGEAWEVTVPVVGRHLALDAAAAILAATIAGVPAQQAASCLENVVLPPMRMEVVHHEGTVVILDTYNASPPAMVNAIETLSELPVEGRRLAVIGEMRELGEHREEAHEMVGHALAQNPPDSICFFGDATEATWNKCLEAGMSPDRFVIANELGDVTDFLRTMRTGDVVLIKGSRALELETALIPLGIQGGH